MGRDTNAPRRPGNAHLVYLPASVARPLSMPATSLYNEKHPLDIAKTRFFCFLLRGCAQGARPQFLQSYPSTCLPLQWQRRMLLSLAIDAKNPLRFSNPLLHPEVISVRLLMALR